MAKKTKQKIRWTLTPAQAQSIIDAHEIELTMQSDEETELLAANNPELFTAYEVLMCIAADD